MKTTATTQAVSSSPGENEHWNTKWWGTTSCAEKNQGRTGKITCKFREQAENHKNHPRRSWHKTIREIPAYMYLKNILVLMLAIAGGAISAADAPLVTNVVREIVVEKNLLLFPVKNGAAKRIVTASVDGREVRRFNIELADASADWWASLDVGAWTGKTLRVVADALPAKSTALTSLRQSAALPDAENLYREPLRPQFHFSPQRGWVGDPNGLVYYKGDYHLFFQYNPYGLKWGNMHWGHAVSQDLVHWRELPLTLYPAGPGDNPYSGSAVVDTANTAGFKQGAEDPIVIIFPSTRRGVCLTYSTDGGRTFTEFSGNPVCKGQGGDPRVFWHETTRRWIMITCRILKLSPEVPPGKPGWLEKAECGFEFFSSTDLKHWERNSGIADCWECPDLFELPIGGNQKNKKWVLMPNHVPSLCVGGTYAGGRYLVGTFDGKQFTPDTKILQFNFGNTYGAAQSYNNIPAEEGRRINVGCAFNTRMPGMPFSQMMNFPTELTLRTTEEGVRLFAEPIKEIETLYVSTRKFENLPLTPGGTVLPGIAGDLFDLSAEFAVGVDAGEVGLKIRGVPVTFNSKTAQLICADRTAPLKPVAGKIKLRVLVDRVSIEIFANDGRIYMPMTANPPDAERSIAVFGAGDDAKLAALTVNTLKSAW